MNIHDDAADHLHTALGTAVLFGGPTAVDDVLTDPAYRLALLDAMGLVVESRFIRRSFEGGPVVNVEGAVGTPVLVVRPRGEAQNV